MSIMKSAVGVGIAGALALAAIAPAAAAPVLSNTVAVKSALSSQVTDVAWRRGGRGIGVAAGVIGGLALGAAIASQPGYYSPGYYDPGYDPYAYGYYDERYAAPRVYSYDAYPRRYYGGDSRGYVNGHVDTNAAGNW